MVLYPFSDIAFQPSGDIEGYGFPFFFPSDIEDGVFGPSVMAGAIVFSTEAGGGDEGAFDPGVKRCYFLEEFKLFGG
jgi:hypothetical protein